MDGGAWWAAIHGVAKSRTRLSDFTFASHFHALEKEMAAHSSVLAWRIPGTGEPGGLLSMGSHRVRHDWSDLATAAAAYTIGENVPWKKCLNESHPAQVTSTIRKNALDSFSKNSLLRYRWFTILCWFLLYITVIQLHIYLYTYIHIHSFPL